MNVKKKCIERTKSIKGVRRRKDGGEGEHKNVPIQEIDLIHGLLDLKK